MGIRVAVLLALIISCPVQGADNSGPWPRFRGPNGSGVATDQQPPIEIGPEKNVRWKVTVPEGLSSPIIVGDKLVITAVQDGSLYTIAYNRADGTEAWRAQARLESLRCIIRRKAVRLLRRPRPTANTSFRTSVRVACSAMTSRVRSSGDLSCRWRPHWVITAQEYRRSSPKARSYCCEMTRAMRRSLRVTSPPAKLNGRRSGLPAAALAHPSYGRPTKAPRSLQPATPG